MKRRTVFRTPPPTLLTASEHSAQSARAKANRQDTAAISQLVAALGDSDDNIRWLAGSALGILGGSNVVRTLAAFLDQAESPEARQAAIKALQRIADNPQEDEAVRQMAQELVG